MKNTRLRLPLILLLLALLCTALLIGWSYSNAKRLATINSFDDCANASYPILDSYPEQCKMPNGRTFVRAIPGETVTITGETVCLPHRKTDGPQTLECALGIKKDDSTYYAIRDPQMKFFNALPTGKRAALTGKLITEQSNAMSIYNISGIIEITSTNDAE